MCGILVGFSKRDPIDVESFDHALNKLNSRGPDLSFREIYARGRLYLGQTVLSITGNPSLHLDSYHKSLTHRYDVVYNGEIYNYQELAEQFLKKPDRFCESDTEILVNLHEIKAPAEVFKRLKGMFAYILYDSEKNSLYVARDMIGEKILYSYEDNDHLIISSELAPILVLKPLISINRDVLRGYFFTRHLLTPKHTVFEGIEVLAPGCLLEYKLDEKRFKVLIEKKPADLINPQTILENKKKSLDELADQFEAVLKENARRLIPASKQYATILSGGVDSSLLSYFFVKQNSPPAFHMALVFPNKDKASENLSFFENHLNRFITQIRVDIPLFQSFFERSYRAVCGPLPTHSFVSQAILTHYVREKGIKVLIGGDGGDELFGGYEFYKRLKSLITFPSTNPSIYSGVVHHGLEFDDWKAGGLAQEIQDRWKRFSCYYEFEENPRERLVQTVLYSDTVIQLESTGIRSADTMSMLHSVEGRCFYLTQEIIEFALNLPAFSKINIDSNDENNITRPLLKTLFIRKFRKELLFPKQGFSGFPNEAGKVLAGHDYSHTKKLLGLRQLPSLEGELGHAIEWKLMNTELFLQYFSGHIGKNLPQAVKSL